MEAVQQVHHSNTDGPYMQTYLSIKEQRAILSWLAEGESWRLEGEDEPSVKFHTTSVELQLNWLDKLTFSDGDVYTWKKVGSLSSNITIFIAVSTCIVCHPKCYQLMYQPALQDMLQPEQSV